MSKKSTIQPFGPLFIITAAVLWSIDAYLRTSLYALPPVLVSFWEHLLGLVIITPFFLPRWKEVQKLTKKEWGGIITVALFASSLGVIFYTYALGQVGFAEFSVVVLLQQTQPIWAIITAAVILKEPVTKHFVAWALLSMVGVYLIVFKDLVPNLDTGASTVTAGVFALLAAVAWGSGTSLGKLVLNKVSFGVTAFLRFSLAAVFSFILFTLFSILQQVGGAETVFGSSYAFNQIGALSGEQWQSIMLIVLITGATAFLIYYYGLKRTPARVATICELAWPASALLIGIVWFGNTFTWSQILGMLILTVSMVVVSFSQKEGVGYVMEKE